MTGAAPRKARVPALRPAMAAVPALRAALREAIAQIRANTPGAARGADPEFLHQLRVGARRLRAVLRASRGAWREDDLRRLRRRLRQLAAVTGPARDWDVQVSRLAPRLRAGARKRQRMALAALRRELLAQPPWRLPRARRNARPPFSDYVRAALERLDTKARRRGARIDWRSADARHALRIRLRRLRYVAELLQGALPRADIQPIVARLRELQALLGELNDIEVGRRLRAELGAPARSGQARERALLARLPAAWRRFASAPRFWRPK